jgi:hypothetical protein
LISWLIFSVLEVWYLYHNILLDAFQKQC